MRWILINRKIYLNVSVILNSVILNDVYVAQTWIPEYSWINWINQVETFDCFCVSDVSVVYQPYLSVATIFR